MTGDVGSKGPLYPARLPTFHRLRPPERAAPFVRWFWIPEWHIEPGRSSRQHLIAYPACNLVVESSMVGISGPTTRASHRDLTAEGWAVGALLHPAAVHTFVPDPARIRDAYLALDLPDLHDAIAGAMTSDAPGERRRERAVAQFTAWLAAHLPEPTPDAVLAGQIVEVIDADPGLRTVGDIADRFDISVRTVQRLARRFVGVTPAAMIRRRRLQEAAARLRSGDRADRADLASVAYELGYADQAHLAGDFRRVLGFTPSRYRRAADTEPGAQPTRTEVTD